MKWNQDERKRGSLVLVKHEQIVVIAFARGLNYIAPMGYSRNHRIKQNPNPKADKVLARKKARRLDREKSCSSVDPSTFITTMTKRKCTVRDTMIA
jgi:hypothetical protein